MVIGNGESDEVIELQEARVVVTQCQAECVGEAHEQERFRGTVIADEEQRLFGGECGEERGLERVVADDAKGAQKRTGRLGCCHTNTSAPKGRRA